MTDILFWIFLIGLGLALNGARIFVLLVRHGQYTDPEKAKFRMLENEVRDDQQFAPEMARV